MAKKKSGKSKSKKSNPPRKSDNILLPVSEFNEMLQSLSPHDLQQLVDNLPPHLSGLLPKPPRSNKAKNDLARQAQELIEQAYNAPNEQQATRLALEALKLDERCAEAYLLLGDTAASAEEAADLYRSAMQAAEANIGRAEFQQLRGEFWGFAETRPYMQARFQFANCLWALGKRDEAIGHYEELLELNPNDNQGVRYELATHYLDVRRLESLGKLLERYDEDPAPEFMYARALSQFRQAGDTPNSRAALVAAYQANKHVPGYLLGEKVLPLEQPEWVTAGGKDEAITYVFQARGTWTSTPEALAWMREALADKRKAPASKKLNKITLTAAERRKLCRLPLVLDEVWQAGIRPALAPLREHLGADAQMAMVCSSDCELPLGIAPCEVPQDSALDLWNCLVEAMQDPADGQPRRPAVVELESGPHFEMLKAPLSSLGIEVRQRDQLDLRSSPFDALEGTSFSDAMRPAGSYPAVSADELLALPQSVEAWQVDMRALPIWSEEGGRLERPWSVLALSSTGGAVYAQSFDSDEPTLNSLWNVLAGTMVSPMMGPPHRPAKLETSNDEWANFLAARCEPIGIEVCVQPRLAQVDEYLDGMQQRSGPDVPAITAIAGVTTESLASFYAAAAGFFRAALWRRVAMDRIFRLTRLGKREATWFGMVMGQSGLEFGLALYERLDDVRATFDRTSTFADLKKRSCMSLMYEESYRLAFADVDAIEQHAWPISAPEAYPIAIRLKPKNDLGLPNADELGFLDGAIRALIQNGADATTEPKTCTVSVGGQDAQFEVQVVPL